MKIFAIIITVLFVLAVIKSIYDGRTKDACVSKLINQADSVKWLENWSYYTISAIAWIFDLIVTSFLIYACVKL